MKYKILKLNKDGSVTLTKEELEQMLEETYNDGYAAGYASNQTTIVPTTPIIKPWWEQPYVTWTCDDALTPSTITMSYGIGDEYIKSDPLPESFYNIKEDKGAF